MKPDRVKIAPALLDVLAEVPGAVALAEAAGLTIRLAFPIAGETVTLHAMIAELRTGRRVANWWPATSLAMLCAANERFPAATWGELFALLAEPAEAAA